MTTVRVEPRPCDQGSRKNNGFVLLVTQPPMLKYDVVCLDFIFFFVILLEIKIFTAYLSSKYGTIILIKSLIENKYSFQQSILK